MPGCDWNYTICPEDGFVHGIGSYPDEPRQSFDVGDIKIIELYTISLFDLNDRNKKVVVDVSNQQELNDPGKFKNYIFENCFDECEMVIDAIGEDSAANVYHVQIEVPKTKLGDCATNIEMHEDDLAELLKM